MTETTSLALCFEVTNFYAHLIGIRLDSASIPLLRQIYLNSKQNRFNIPTGVTKEQFLKETEILATALKSGASITLNPVPPALAFRLQRLNIAIDGDVQKAIAQYGLSSAIDAIYHVDSFSHTIKNKKAAFLLRIEQPPVDIVTQLRSQMKFIEREMQTPQYKSVAKDSFNKIRLKLKK